MAKGTKKGKSLYRFLLEIHLELLIRKRNEKLTFDEDVALGSVLFAIKEATEKIGNKGKE